MLRLFSICILILSMGTACTTVNRALINNIDKTDFDAAGSMYISMGDLPADTYTPIGLIYARRNGYKFLGFIPFVRANLEKLLYKRLVDEARQLGADGIINVSFSYKAFPNIPYVLITLGYFKSVRITGMAVQLKDPSLIDKEKQIEPSPSS